MTSTITPEKVISECKLSNTTLLGTTIANGTFLADTVQSLGNLLVGSGIPARFQTGAGVTSVGAPSFDTNISLAGSLTGGGGGILLMLCTQNNPDGTYLRLDLIRRRYDGPTSWTSSSTTVVNLATLNTNTIVSFSASANGTLLVTTSGAFNYRWTAFVL
jgi:hypothetical protein